MEKEKNTASVSDRELTELANIYKQLWGPNRSFIVSNASLLLASQNATRRRGVRRTPKEME